jgi:hypothetical protein
VPRRPAVSFSPEHWGVLASTNPFSDQFGIDRGTPIDRIFIDTFINQHSSLIRGQVLEIGDDRYSRRYVGDVTATDIVDVDPDNGSATLVADLARPGSLPLERYDCAIVTQTLQYVADLETAMHNLCDCLIPGTGALLATVPGIARVDPGNGRPGDRWRFTPRGLFDLLAGVFAPDEIACVGYGDLHTATAFLYGLAAEDVGLASGAERTSDFPVVVCARAVRR